MMNGRGIWTGMQSNAKYVGQFKDSYLDGDGVYQDEHIKITG